MSFGSFIRIERQLSGRDYYCRYGITGEVFLVHVEPEFGGEVEERYAEEEEEETGKEPGRNGCPFRCRNPEGEGFSCAIYPTRPKVCRKFRCYRMLIYHTASQELRGKIIGNAELRTQDTSLAAIWREWIASLPRPVAGGGAGSASDDREWIGRVTAILAAHGYRGEPVD